MHSRPIQTPESNVSLPSALETPTIDPASLPNAILRCINASRDLLTGQLLLNGKPPDITDPLALAPEFGRQAPRRANNYPRFIDVAGFIIRRYPDPEIRPIDIDVAQLHFGVLRDFEMDIVPHVFLKAPNDPSTQGYAVSRSIPKLKSIDRLKPSKQREAHTTLRTPLRKYLHWVKESGQKQILLDIFREEQYSVQNGSDRLPFLHDIDPFIVNATPDRLAAFMNRPITRLS